MPTPTTPYVEHGSVRELWLARKSAPSTKWSFLEDPAAGSVRGASFGRTIRLGEPTNLGVTSNWQQLSWVGGRGQTRWRDPEMYEIASADVQSHTGKIRMWPGWQSIAKWENADAPRYILCEGSGAGEHMTNTSLIIAGGDQWYWSPRQPAYYAYRITGGDVTQPGNMQFIGWHNTPFRSLLQVKSDDYSDGVVFATCADRFFVFYENVPGVAPLSWFNDESRPDPNVWGEFCADSMVSFNDAVYYLQGETLMKRVPHPQGYGVTGIHTAIKSIRPAIWLRGMTVWNNRLWFGAYYAQGKSAVYTSDGATVVKAFDFPGEFSPMSMVSHYGALYIQGVSTGSALWSDVQQQIWRYDGTNLRMLWAESEGYDGYHHWGGGIASLGRNLVWGRDGIATTDSSVADDRACVMYYDAETDAIIDGPGVPRPPADTSSTQIRVSQVGTWNNTVVAYFVDTHNYGAGYPAMIAYIKPQTSVRHDFRGHFPGVGHSFRPDLRTGEQISYLNSSEYHGPDDVATEQKTWLAARVRYRLWSQYNSVRFYVSLDGGPWQLMGTLTWSGSNAWATALIPLEVDGEYLQSETIKYRVELINDEGANVASTNTVEIDAVSIQYIVAPQRRRQWTLRILTGDNQGRLDGTANPLTTNEALADKIEELWAENQPLLFWPPSTGGGTPTEDGIEVIITDYHRQAYRLANNSEQLTGAVTLTLVENVVT